MPTPSRHEQAFNASEAKEFIELQKAICEKLSTDRITSVAQLEPALIEPTRVHLVTCKVENHHPIAGLYTDDE